MDIAITNATSTNKGHVLTKPFCPIVTGPPFSICDIVSGTSFATKFKSPVTVTPSGALPSKLAIGNRKLTAIAQTAMKRNKVCLRCIIIFFFNYLYLLFLKLEFCDIRGVTVMPFSQHLSVLQEDKSGVGSQHGFNCGHVCKKELHIVQLVGIKE